MSVIIKGMAMPETCYERRFWEYYSDKQFCVAHLNLIEEPRSGRLDTCPLDSEVKETKPGKWIYPTDIVGFGRCGNCKALWSASLITNKFVKYCPRCGHPMELCKEEYEDENWYTELDGRSEE